MITLIVMMIKFIFWLAFLPLQILLLPLTILSGGSKSGNTKSNNSNGEDVLMSAAFLDETIDDYWWGE